MANPIVTITMANGDVMKAELYPEVAPNTVNNFISLPVFRRSTRKFPAFLFFSFFVSSSVPRFFLYLQQIFNALSGLFLLEKFF